VSPLLHYGRRARVVSIPFTTLAKFLPDRIKRINNRKLE
jgi:hypothetical protein